MSRPSRPAPRAPTDTPPPLFSAAPPPPRKKKTISYAETQEYRPHSDYFTHPKKDENGGNRMATVLMYLSTPDKGGETVFPRVKPPKSQTDDPSFSACAQKGLAVKARKGDAVLFWSIRPDGRFDPGSHHGGCPVEEGVKYAATKWWVFVSFASCERNEGAGAAQGGAPPPRACAADLSRFEEKTAPKHQPTQNTPPSQKNTTKQHNKHKTKQTQQTKQDPRRPLCRGL